MTRRPPLPADDVDEWFKNTCCGGCQAARLLSWSLDPDALSFSGDRDQPQHAVRLEAHLAAVHCDYFKRRVEQPDKLTFCGARRSG